MTSRQKDRRWPDVTCPECGRRVKASESHSWRYDGPHGSLVIRHLECAYRAK